MDQNEEAGEAPTASAALPPGMLLMQFFVYVRAYGSLLEVSLPFKSCLWAYSVIVVHISFL